MNFLVDLGSTHGTFIGTLRLEAHKPTVVQIGRQNSQLAYLNIQSHQFQLGASFHFGASTRNYILRERVKTQNIVEDLPGSAETVLPENEEEVNQITEYNTAHNRKISTLGITENIVVKKGLKRKQVHFNDDEIIINPEDIDPTIGRFRNLVQSTVIPMSSKKMRLDNSGNFGLNTASSASSSSTEQKHILHHPIMSAPATVGLYSGLCEPEISKFLLPNPAPEIDSIKVSSSSQIQFKHNDDDYSIGDYDPEPRKKKYKKETWHGAKKPVKAFGDI